MNVITDLFVNKHGSFSKTLQFEALALFVGILIFFNYYFKKNYGFVIILIVFALYIANTYTTIRQNVSTDFNVETMDKLNSLQKSSDTVVTRKIILTHNGAYNGANTNVQNLLNDSELNSMYIDANMIHFLHSILPLQNYNDTEFYLVLQATNNILKIKKEIDIFYEANGAFPSNTSELFEESLQQKTNAINNLHNLIYSIPKSKATYNYLGDIIDRYTVLISRVTDSIHKSYLENIKLRGLSTSTKFVSYDTTKPHDTSENNLSKFYN